LYALLVFLRFRALIQRALCVTSGFGFPEAERTFADIAVKAACIAVCDCAVHVFTPWAAYAFDCMAQLANLRASYENFCRGGQIADELRDAAWDAIAEQAGFATFLTWRADRQEQRLAQWLGRGDDDDNVSSLTTFFTRNAEFSFTSPGGE
jgi:hypothetical protein